MRREGCNEENLLPTDFLCDYCGNTWSDDRPMIEGHRGSLVCAKCLSLAFDSLWNHAPAWDGTSPPPPVPDDQQLPEGVLCMLCLEHREEPCWHSPMMDASWICKRCTKQSVVMLERDPEFGYARPAKA